MIREDLCVIAEELGRSLAPTPFASSVYLATEAPLIAGDEDKMPRYLPELAGGEAIGCFAMAEGVGIPSPATVKTTFQDGKLSGVKKPILDGDIADFAIVVARTAETGDESLSLVLVDLTADGVRREMVDGRSHALARGDHVRRHGRGAFRCDRTRLVVDGEVFDRAAIYLAFEQVGGAQAALDMAVDYAQNRFAFGRAIGSFQAIKHKLVNIYVDLELARANAYRRLGSDERCAGPAGCGRRRAGIRLKRSTMRRGRISKRMAAWASPGSSIVVSITGARNNCRWRLAANGAGPIA